MEQEFQNDSRSDILFIPCESASECLLFYYNLNMIAPTRLELN